MQNKRPAAEATRLQSGQLPPLVEIRQGANLPRLSFEVLPQPFRHKAIERFGFPPLEIDGRNCVFQEPLVLLQGKDDDTTLLRYEAFRNPRDFCGTACPHSESLTRTPRKGRLMKTQRRGQR